MASNSSQPDKPEKTSRKKISGDSTGTPKKQTAKKSDESNSEDNDFWSIDTNLDEIDESSDELEELDGFLNSPVLPMGKNKTLSEISNTHAELQDIDDEDIINRLDQAHGKTDRVTVKTLSDEALQEYHDQEIVEQQTTTQQSKVKKENKEARSPIELAATLVCVLLLIGLGIYFYQYRNSRFDIKTEEEWVTNIPVEGDYAHIENVKTWWSEPGQGAKLGVKLVPCVTITLANNAKSGALRVIFFSSEDGLSEGEKRAKGDPFPLKFKNGIFENGKNSITIRGTDGFNSVAEFNAYRIQYKERWTVKIKEGPSLDTRSADFKELGHAPIPASLCGYRS